MGPDSPEAMDVWHYRAVAARDSRPWRALDFYQRLLDLKQSAGPLDADLLDIRSDRHPPARCRRISAPRRICRRVATRRPGRGEGAARHPLSARDRGHAARLRARALWHLGDPKALAAYGVAIDTAFAFDDGDMARLLLKDLIDARYDSETVRVADALLGAVPGDPDALFAKARVAARAGNFAEAATLVAGIAGPSPIARCSAPPISRRPAIRMRPPLSEGVSPSPSPRTSPAGARGPN